MSVALRRQVPLASLVIVEAPAAELLRETGEHQHYRAFRDMTDAYFAAFQNKENEAIAALIDFYGGADTFASWPSRVRRFRQQRDKHAEVRGTSRRRGLLRLLGQLRAGRNARTR